jgi:hypothetical protein
MLSNRAGDIEIPSKSDYMDGTWTTIAAFAKARSSETDVMPWKDGG